MVDLKRLKYIYIIYIKERECVCEIDRGASPCVPFFLKFPTGEDNQQQQQWKYKQPEREWRKQRETGKTKLCVCVCVFVYE